MEIAVKNEQVFLVHRFNESDENYLMHYGVLGMKWGVRRYRNEDGTLTEEGKKRELKRLSKNGKVTISKGSDLMRVSTRSESDAKEGGKLYVTPDKKEHETYKRMMGTTDVLKTGKAYVQKYIAVEMEFENLGLSLTDDEIAEIETSMESYWGYYGEFYSENGIGEESFKDIMTLNYKSSAVFSAYYGEDGSFEVPEDDMLSYYDEKLCESKIHTA